MLTKNDILINQIIFINPKRLNFYKKKVELDFSGIFQIKFKIIKSIFLVDILFFYRWLLMKSLYKL